MTLQPSSPYFQKLMALSLLGLCLIAIWTLIFLPLSMHFAGLVKSIDFERVRFEELAKRRPDLISLRSRQDALADSSADTRAFISARNAQLAVAFLQSSVRALLERHGASMDRATVAPSKEEEGLTRVGLEFVTSLPEKGLLAVLSALETQEPSLFLGYARLRSSRSKTKDVGDPAVDVEVHIHGYMRSQP